MNHSLSRLGAAAIAILVNLSPAIAADACDDFTAQEIFDSYETASAKSHSTMVMDRLAMYPDNGGCVVVGQMGWPGQRLGWLQHFMVKRQGDHLVLTPFLLSLSAPQQRVWRY